MVCKKFTFGTALVALLVLLWVTGGVVAGPPLEGPEGDVSIAATVGSKINYQGVLKENGSPVTGSRNMTFRLYSDDTCSIQVGSDIVKSDVEVTDGLFGVELDVTHSDFNGQGLWLDVEVGGTKIGCQPIQAVPYALSLRPGAVISGTTPSGQPILTVQTNQWGDGIRVSAGDDGVHVTSAGDDGVHVTSAGDDGVHVEYAGDDGVSVFKAGDPTTTSSSTGKNGFDVAGAEGFGLYVGRADWDGVRVTSAGDDGVNVWSASDHGVSVRSAGDDGVNVWSAGDDGVQVDFAVGDGVYVESAGGDGVYVGSTGNDGFYVYSAGYDGLYVREAARIAVYGNTTQAQQEWGLYTPDKLFVGTTFASGGPLMFVVQNGDGRNLETGDVVAVSGAGATFADGEFPVPLVQRASRVNSAAAVGVVYRRFVAEEEVEEFEHEGKVERLTSIHAHSTEGPIAPGNYLLIVVLGPAQVKADASPGSIRPGDPLTASNGGQATRAEPVKVSGVEFYPPGAIIGKAMEPLDAAQGSGLVWVLVMFQ